MAELIAEAPMSPELWLIAAWGVGSAYALSLVVVLVLLWKAEIDHGFLGLIFLLTMVLFVVALSFVIAAGTPGWSIKAAVTVFNGLLAFGSRLLSDRFLKYLESE